MGEVCKIVIICDEMLVYMFDISAVMVSTEWKQKLAGGIMHLVGLMWKIH